MTFRRMSLLAIDLFFENQQYIFIQHIFDKMHNRVLQGVSYFLYTLHNDTNSYQELYNAI